MSQNRSKKILGKYSHFLWKSTFIFSACFLRWELKRLLEWNPPKKGLKIFFREVESAIFLAWNVHRRLAPPNTVRNFWSAKRGIEGDDPRSLCAYLPSAELLALLAFRRAATVHRGARPRFAPSSAKCWPCWLSTPTWKAALWPFRP